MKYLIISLFAIWWLTVDLQGQSNSNPFEVRGRISHQNGTADSSKTKPVLIDSTGQSKVSENPFDVDHIPLRRTQTQTSTIINPLKEINQVKPKVSNRFVFWIMLFSWALLAIVITNKTNLISYMIRSVFNLNMMKLTKRDEGGTMSFHYVLLYFIFIINLSIFIYLFQKQYSSKDGITIWIYCLIAIIAIYFIRHTFLYMLGKIFPIEKEISLYNYIIVVFNILLGIMIIPVNLILSYGPENLHKTFFLVGFVLIGIFLLIRYLRGLSMGVYVISLGIIPFLIYLCTAEIAPVLIMIRAISNLKG